MKKYKTKCIKCHKRLVLTDQPDQPKCSCGSNIATYKGRNVIINWTTKS